MRQRGTEWVAIVVAVGFALGFNLFCFAVLYDAVTNDSPLSENATQVLTGWGGGMIGLLGGFMGYRAGTSERNRKEENHVSDQE